MAFKIADGYVEVHARLDANSFRRVSRDVVEHEAGRSGDRAGHRFTNAFDRSVRRDRGRLRRLFGDLFTPDKEAMSGLLHPLETLLSTPIVGALGVSIGAAVLEVVATAVTSGILLGIGGAVVAGAGAILAKKLKPSFQRAKNTIVETLQEAAAPLQGTFTQAFRDIALMVKNLEPELKKLFKAAEPIIPLLVDIFGDFAKELVPAIVDNMPAIVELFQTLSDRAPEIADAITRMLDKMSEKDTITAFNHLLSLTIITIDLLTATLGFLVTSFNQDVEDFKHGGQLIKDVFANVAEFMIRFERSSLEIVGTMIEGILRLFSKLPGPMGAPFRSALASVIRARAGINKQLDALQQRIYRLRGTSIEITTYYREVVLRNPGSGAFASAREQPRATGGIVGAQAGGIMGGRGMASGGLSGFSRVLVGEQGPELVNLPVGSKVTPAGQTRAQLEHAAGGGGGRLVLEVRSGGSRMDDLLVEIMRKAIRARGGDVQAVLGT